jgi:hypothetical protein
MKIISDSSFSTGYYTSHRKIVIDINGLVITCVMCQPIKESEVLETLECVIQKYQNK